MPANGDGHQLSSGSERHGERACAPLGGLKDFVVVVQGGGDALHAACGTAVGAGARQHGNECEVGAAAVVPRSRAHVLLLYPNPHLPHHKHSLNHNVFESYGCADEETVL